MTVSVSSRSVYSLICYYQTQDFRKAVVSVSSRSVYSLIGLAHINGNDDPVSVSSRSVYSLISNVPKIEL